MNEKFLRGFQKATVDCLCFDIDFMKNVIEDLNPWDKFAEGFIKGVEMFESNKDLIEDIEEAKKL